MGQGRSFIGITQHLYWACSQLDACLAPSSCPVRRLASRSMTTVLPTVLQSPPVVARSSEPSHQQIERWLIAAIESGALGQGDRLPPERDLAAALHVSRMTLRQSLGALEARGLLVRVMGRKGGTFVREPPIACDLTTLAGLSEQLRRHGVRAGARVIKAVERVAPEQVTRALGIDEGATVFEIVRLRDANGQPIALEQSFFPSGRFPGMLAEPLGGSLYSLLEQRYGSRPIRAFESLEAVSVGSPEAELLGIPPGSALMRVERTAYAEDSVAVEYASDLYRSDRARIVVSSSAASA